MKYGKTFFISLCFIFSLPVFSQEALKSPEEEYCDFLSLTGNSQKNYMLYRTLEESRWSLDSEDDKNVWSQKNTGFTRKIFESGNESRNWFTAGFEHSVSYKVFGTEWFSSYNTTAPLGQNDGALWQGRGYNTAFTGGARIEGYGFSLSLRPQLSFSQNRDYDYIVDGFNDAKYKGLAAEYGYIWGNICDAVQRFGDSSFWNFDWGDTEIRWSWNTFTVGFGTEAVWTGPSSVNSILNSNNAPTYPKFDIGLRKTPVTLPKLGWYIGDFETRLWIGYLSESDYFDNDSTNDHNQIAGFTIAYAPSFIPGFTLGFTKMTISKWGDDFWLYLNPGFYGNTVDDSTGRVGEDQKASLTADWLFTGIGLDIYGELGFDDFLAEGLGLYEYLRYPFHAVTYTIGLKKTFDISNPKKVRALLQFEWNNTEGSQDYQLWTGSGYNFGFHYQVTQGYTNEGQWIGSGTGYGGNSQHLSFTVYSPHGYEKLFIARNNPDNNYIYYKAVDAGKAQTEYLGMRYYTAFKANFLVGFENLRYITDSFSVRYGFCYNMIINPTYEPGLNSEQNAWREYSYAHNFNFTLALKYYL